MTATETAAPEPQDKAAVFPDPVGVVGDIYSGIDMDIQGPDVTDCVIMEEEELGVTDFFSDLMGEDDEDGDGIPDFLQVTGICVLGACILVLCCELTPLFTGGHSILHGKGKPFPCYVPKPGRIHCIRQRCVPPHHLEHGASYYMLL